MTETLRDEARALLADFKAIANGTYRGPQDIAKDRLALLTKMLLGYPVASNVSEAMADARLDSYNDALSDVPPWAIDAGVKRWNRGECDHLGMGALNYNFPPAPAILRRLCRHEMESLLGDIQKLERLLFAVSIERAMDPAPLPARPDLFIVDQTGRQQAIGLKRV